MINIILSLEMIEPQKAVEILELLFQDSVNNQRPPGNQYFINNWRPEPGQDDGQVM